MKTKILISAIALTFGSAAMAADTSMSTEGDVSAKPETELGDPNVQQQGPAGGPANAQPEMELGSQDVQTQGDEGAPAGAVVERDLGSDEIQQQGTSPREGSNIARFSEYDKDNDGYIVLDDVDGDVKNDLAAADANADGRIDEAEFSAFEASYEGSADIETKSGNPSEDLTESGRAMDKMEKSEDR